MTGDPGRDLEHELRATLRAHAGPPHTSLTADGIRAAATRAHVPATMRVPTGGGPASGQVSQMNRRQQRKVVPWLAAAAVAGITCAALFIGGGSPEVPPASPAPTPAFSDVAPTSTSFSTPDSTTETTPATSG